MRSGEEGGAVPLMGDGTLSQDFPSLVDVRVLPRVSDPSPAKRMIGQLLSAIRSSGSRGAFCELRHSDRRMLDFYSKLGSFRPVQAEGLPEGMNSRPSYFTSPIFSSGISTRPSSEKAGVVVRPPVLVAHRPGGADHLHPLRVVVDHLSGRGGPLLPQAANVQALILHRQPLRLKP
ncbi:unnamed protein product [Menidia menidia]|uniref:(Atlantic silverside) hypothetical protein n=1 Tax=Menidia menidia TaxID=238744 RepID=A0A8S4BA37_9TELE|nr:unnamed protein product [Menidia menidia]